MTLRVSAQTKIAAVMLNIIKETRNEKIFSFESLDHGGDLFVA